MQQFVEDLLFTAEPILIVGAIALAVTFAVARARSGIRAAVRATLWVLLTLGIATLLWWALLIDNPSAAQAQQVNLVPFREIARGLRAIDQGYGIVNIWGNLVVFLPIGALTMLLARVRWWTAVGLCAVLSIGIEVTQQFLGRSSDIDDVILNTIGGAVGVAIAWAFLRVRGRRARSFPAQPVST